MEPRIFVTRIRCRSRESVRIPSDIATTHSDAGVRSFEEVAMENETFDQDRQVDAKIALR